MNKKVMPGYKFGRYTVLYPDKCRKHHWICECLCGTVKSVREDHIFDGRIISCGCHKDENTSARLRTHGKSKTALYRTYKHIIGRCCCETDTAFPRYGGRGIAICDEWRNDFLSFYDWAIKNGYKPSLTIDRIDNNASYSPHNCRWVGWDVQANNKRNNHFIEHNGIRLTVSQWAHKLDMNPKILDNRLRRGWSEERALTQPLRIR